MIIARKICGKIILCDGAVRRTAVEIDAPADDIQVMHAAVRSAVGVGDDEMVFAGVRIVGTHENVALPVGRKTGSCVHILDQQLRSPAQYGDTV